MSNHIITSQNRIPPLHDHEPPRAQHQTCLLPVLMLDPGSTYTGQWVGDDRSGEGVQVWKEIWMWHDVTVLSRWNGHNLQLKKGSSDIDRSNIERKFTLNVKSRMHNIIHIFLHVSIIVVGFMLRYNLPVFSSNCCIPKSFSTGTGWLYTPCPLGGQDHGPMVGCIPIPKLCLMLHRLLLYYIVCRPIMFVV